MKKIMFLTAVLLMVGVVQKMNAQDETKNYEDIILEPYYDEVKLGAEGLFVVTTKGKKAVVSHDGKKVIVPLYDNVYAGEQGEDSVYLISVSSNYERIEVIDGIDKVRRDTVTDQKYGIYSKDGEVLHPTNIYGSLYIDGGMMVHSTTGEIYDNIFEKGRVIKEKNNTYKKAVYRRDGTLIDIYDSFLSNSDKCEWSGGEPWDAVTVSKDGKYGVLYKGKIIIPVEYDDVYVNSCSQLAEVSKNGKRGVLNNKGEVIVPVGKYDAVSVSRNYIKVKKNGKEGILNSKGVMIVPIGTYSGYNIEKCDWDKKQEYIEVNSNGKKGVLNENGKVFIPIGKYESFTVLNKDIAIVKSNRITGIVNKNGTLIVPIGKYEKLSYRYGVLIYSKNGKFGILGKDGKEVTGAEYDIMEAARHSYGIALVKKDNKLGMINCDGKIIVPLGDYNDGNVNEGIGYMKNDEGTMYFDISGKVLAPIGKREKCMQKYGIKILSPLKCNSEEGLFKIEYNKKYGIIKLW